MSEGVRSSLLRELEHRRVHHTTAAYAASVFVVWQVADITFPVLGLPASFMRFVVVAALLGFPVAVAASWLLEVVPQRPMPAAPPTRSPAPRPRIRRAVGLGLAILGAVLALAAAGWSVAPRSAAVEEGAWVILADVVNESDDPSLAGAVLDALRVSLAQSQHVAVLPPARVREGLTRMRRAPDTPLDEAIATELAVREGVAVVLVPSVRRLGATTQISARIVDPQLGETVGSHTVRAEHDDRLLPALDELAREIRQGFGESLASLVQGRIELYSATTASLEALRAWSEANRLWATARFGEARVLLERAVDLDSTFALAHADLGQWYHNQGNDPLMGNRYFEAALRHTDGLPEPERLFIEGKAQEWTGDREAAAVTYRTITTLRPNNRIAWSNLAYQYMRLGRADEAIETYARVLELDSLDANAWINVASAHSSAGRAEEAIPAYEKAFAREPRYLESPGVNEEYGHSLVAVGRLEDAGRAYEVMLDGADGDRARGLRSMALLRMFEGRHAEAADLLREAVAIHESSGGYVSELRDRSFRATALQRLDRQAEAATELARAGDLAVNRFVATYFVAVPGIQLARAGEVGRATELLDTARARSNGGPDDSVPVLLLDAEIALAQDDPLRALERVRDATALDPNHFRLPYVTARVEWAAGQAEDAATTLQATVDRGLETMSREAQDEWIVAHYLLGRVHEELGRAEAARLTYQQFLAIWGVPDSPVPEVLDARTRLAAAGGLP